MSSEPPKEYEKKELPSPAVLGKLTSPATHLLDSDPHPSQGKSSATAPDIQDIHDLESQSPTTRAGEEGTRVSTDSNESSTAAKPAVSTPAASELQAIGTGNENIGEANRKLGESCGVPGNGRGGID